MIGLAAIVPPEMRHDPRGCSAAPGTKTLYCALVDARCAYSPRESSEYGRSLLLLSAGFYGAILAKRGTFGRWRGQTEQCAQVRIVTDRRAGPLFRKSHQASSLRWLTTRRRERLK
jgi:hypothetical protein